jgi:hypothetical protein
LEKFGSPGHVVEVEMGHEDPVHARGVFHQPAGNACVDQEETLRGVPQNVGVAAERASDALS